MLSPVYAATFMGLGGGILLQAMNALLMSTVVPSAVAEIGGLAYMNWPTTGFLAVSVVGAAGGSLLRQAVGGQRAYAVAALLFTLGAAISAAAPTIWVLILGRMVQGAGGGLLSALAYMLVRVAFPEALWSRVFAMFNSMWGIAILLGPLVGGVFAGWGFWRGAFIVIAAMALGLAFAALTVFPKDKPEAQPHDASFPIGRLSLITLAILALSSAGPAEQMVFQGGLAALALALFALFIWWDRSTPARLLPRDAFSFNTATGLGLWALLLLMAANDPWAIYGPLLMQVLHGLDPLTAGYAVAIESIGWTLVAFAVVAVPQKWEALCLVAGPLVMGLGLLGIALGLAEAPFILLSIPIFLAGAGIGACYTFIAQRILSGAQAGDEAAAGASVATVQLVGLAIGGAAAGLIANGVGLKGEVNQASAVLASFWIPVSFIPLALSASLFALRLASLGTPPLKTVRTA